MRLKLKSLKYIVAGVLFLFAIHYPLSTILAAPPYNGGTGDGWGIASSSTLYLGGGTSPAVSISSLNNQIFRPSQISTAISPITITDASTSLITATGDIRISIPLGFLMSWDTTDTTAVITGTAASKVSSTVSYENNGRILKIDVTSDFSAGQNITVSGLNFTNFTDYSRQIDNLELYLVSDVTGVVIVVDNKFISISDQYSGGLGDGWALNESPAMRFDSNMLNYFDLIPGTYTQTAGANNTITITAKNPGGGTITGYVPQSTVTVRKTETGGSSPNTATLKRGADAPAQTVTLTSADFSNGIASVTLTDTEAPEDVTVFAKDDTAGIESSTFIPITFSAETTIDHYNVPNPSPQTLGIGWSEVVTAHDTYDNTVIAASNSFTMTNSGGAKFYTNGSYNVEDASYTLSSGVATIYVKDTLNSETITLTATSTGPKIGTSGNIVVNPGVLTGTDVAPEFLAVNYYPCLVYINFTTACPIPVDGKIKVTFPVGFDLSGIGSGDVFSLGGDLSDFNLSLSIAGQEVTIIRDGTGSIVSAGAVIDDLVIFGVKNPGTAGSTGVYQIKTTNNADGVIDQDLNVSADTITAGALTLTDVQPGSLVAGAVGNTTVSFKLVNALLANGKIKIVFGSGFDVSGVTGATSVQIDGTLTTSYSGTTVTVARSGGTQVSAGATINDLVLSGIKNPVVTGSTGVYQIMTTSSADGVIDQDLNVSVDTITAGALSAVNVQPASLVAGALGNATVSFSNANPVPVNGDIQVTFPSGFDITAAGYVSGNTGATASVAGQVLTINLGTQISAAEGASIVLSGIKNPTVTGATGTYAAETQSAADVKIDEGTAASDTITVAALSVTNVQPASLVAGALGNTVVSFTNANPIPATGKIKITFASGFDVAGVTGAASSADIDGTLTASVVGQAVTITRSGGSVIAQGAVIDDLTIAGVKNPVVTGSTGTYSIQTYTSADVPIDEDTAVAADTITAGALLATNVEPEWKVVSTTAKDTITFTLANPLPADGKIKVTFPAGFVLTNVGSGDASSASDLNGTLTISKSGQDITITRAAGTAKAAGSVIDDLIINNVKNPASIGTTGVYAIYTYTAADVAIDQDTAVAADTIVAAGALSATNVESASLVAGATGNAVVTFTLVNPLPNDGKIKVTFGSNFSLTGVTGASSSSDINGTLTISVAGQAVTITRSGASTQIAGGVVIDDLTIAGVKNPVWTGSTGTYAISTTDKLDSVLDTDVAVAADTITAGALVATSVVPASLVVNTSNNVVVSFTLANPLPGNGKIKIAFGTNFDLNAVGLTDVYSSGGDLDGSVIVTKPGGNVLLVSRSGGTQKAAGSVINDLTIRNNKVKNPGIIGSTGVYTIQTQLTTTVPIDEDLAVTASTIVAGAITSANAVVNNKAVGVNTTVTISGQFADAVPAGGYIKVNFPITNVFTFGTVTATSATIGLSGAACTVASNVVKIPVAGGYGGALFSDLILSGITNPETIGNPGVWSISTTNSSDQTIDQAAASFEGDDVITAGAISGANVTITGNTGAGAVPTVNVIGTTTTAIPAGGQVQVTFPSSFVISTTPGAVLASGIAPSLNNVSCSVAGQTVSIPIASGFSAGAFNNLRITSGVTNPPITGDPGTWNITTRNASNIILDQEINLAGTDTITAGALSEANITLTTDLTAGGSPTVNLSGTTTNNIGSVGKIKVTFPAGFIISTTPGQVLASGTAPALASVTCTVSGQVVTIPLASGFSAGAFNNLRITQGINNPYTTGDPGTWTITTTNSSDTVIDQAAGIAGTDTITAGVLGSLTLTAAGGNYSAGATPNYTIAFTTPVPIPQNGDVQVTFDSDYNLSGVAYVSGNNGSTVSYAANVLTVNLGTAVTAGSSVSIVVSGIKNPTFVQTTDIFPIEVQNISDVLMASGTAAAKSITAGPLGSPTVTHAEVSAGAISDTTIAFTTVNTIPVAGKIKVTFASEFNITGSTYVSGNTGATVSFSGQVLTITVGTQVTAASPVSIVISGIRNPRVSGSTGVYPIETQNASSVQIDAGNAPANTITYGALSPATTLVSSATYIAGDNTKDYTIAFVAVNPILADGDVQVTFDSDYNLSGAAYVSGNTGASVSYASNVLTINLGTAVAAGEPVSLVISGIRNPTSAQTTAAYAIETQNASDATIDQGAASGNVITVGTLTGATVTSPSYIAGDNSGNYTIAFTTPVPLPIDGDVQVTFDSDYNLSGAAYVSGNTGASVSYASNVLTINLGTAVNAGTAMSLVVSGIKNPTYTQTTTAYAIELQDASDSVMISGSASGNIIAAGAITPTITRASLVAGATANTTIAFTAANPIGQDGDIEVVFPAGFDITGAAYVSGNAGSTVSTLSQTLIINLGTQVSAGSPVSVVISGIKNPIVSGTTGTYAVETQTIADALIDQGTAAGSVITPGAISPVITHASLVAGAVTNTTIVFTAVNPVYVNGDIQVTYPSGFNITAAAYSSGNSGSTVSVAGQVLTINLGSAVTAGNSVSIVVSGIKNPTITGSTGTYAIETQNVSDVKIDEGTASANTITAGALTSPLISSLTYVVNDNTKDYTIAFVAVNPIPVDGDVQVTFDSDYNLSGAAYVSGNNGSTVSYAANVLTINLGTAVAADELVSLVISGIKNPGYVQTTTDYGIETQNASDVTIDQATIAGKNITAGAVNNPAISLSNTGIQNSTTVTIGASFADTVPAGGYIKISFPTDNTFSFGVVSATSPTIGLSGVICNVASNTVKIPVAAGYSGTVFTDLALSGIANPETTGDPGTWSITTTNSSEAVIDQATGIPGNDTITAGSITQANIVLSSDFKAGGSPVITVSAAFADAVPANGYIKISFPSENLFYLPPGAGAITATSPTIGLTSVSCTVSGNSVKVPVGGGGYGGALFTDLALSGCVNPTVTGDPGTWGITTTTFANVPIDQVTGIGGTDTVIAGVIMPTVTHASLAAGAAANTTVAFTATNPIPVNGDIQITYPSGFNITAAAYSSGNSGATVSVAGQVLTVNLGTAVPASSAVSIVVSGIKNPTVTGSTGTYAVETQNALDVLIDQGTASANTITAGAITPVISHASLAAGAISNTTIAFTATNPIAQNGDLQVTFPSGFDIADAVYVSGNSGATVSVAGQVLTVNLGTAVSAGSSVSIVVSGIKNPLVTGSTGTYAVETQNASDVKIDEGTASANTITAGAITPVISHASLAAGAISNTTIAFTNINPIPLDGDIQVIFPSGFNISAAAFVSGNTDATVSAASQVLTVNLGTAITAGSPVSIVVSGIKNPVITGSAGTYAVETQNAADVLIDQGTADANTITAGVISPALTHSSLVAGATSNTTIAFTTVNAVEQNGDLQVTFPSGFDISAAGYVSGNSGSTVSVAGQVLTINLGTQVTAGGSVNIVVSGIKNPEVSGSTGTYAVETQNASDIQIDAGTAAANTIVSGVLSSVNVEPASLVAHTTGNVTVSFTTANTLSLSGKIKVTFPSGFDLTTITGASSASDINGALAVSVSGQVLTVTRSAGTAIAGGATIDDLVIAGVTNPSELGTTGTYQVATANSSDTVVDEATAVAADIMVGLITVTSPAAAAEWPVAGSRTITWSTSGNINKVDLAYSTNGGSTWTSIASGYQPVGYIANSSASYTWNPVPDVLPAPQTTPTQATLIKVTDAMAGHAALSGTSSSFNIIYYRILWSVLDSESLVNLGELSVVCGSGWTAEGLDSAAGIVRYYSYGEYATTFSKSGYQDGGATWAADANKTVKVYMDSTLTANIPWNAISKLVYDSAANAVKVTSWIEKRGIIKDDPTSVSVAIYNSSNTLITTLDSSNPNSNGVFEQSWDVSAVTSATYLVKTTIIYHSISYAAATTYNLSIEKAEADFRSLTGAQLGTVLSKTSSIQTAVESTIPAQISSAAVATQSKVAEVKTETARILTAAESTLPAKITTAQTEITSNIDTNVKPHVQSGILNRENTVKSGDTVTIRYRTATGKSPAIDVYDSSNTLLLSKAKMSEISTTGVYRYSLEFNRSWGYGDFTIVCSESSQGTMDALNITVIKTSLEAVYNQVSAVLGSTAGISGLKQVADAMNSQFSIIETALNKVGKDLLKDVKDAVGSATALESVSIQLSSVAKQIKQISGETGINLEKLYQVSTDKKKDILYLKNKTQELKAAMELTKQMTDNIANKPITQTWYEYKR